MKPKVIVFRGDIDEESLLVAATLVSCKDTFIIANNKFKSFIEEHWSFDIEAVFNFCSEQAIEEVLAASSLMKVESSKLYFEVIEGSFKELQFNSFNQSTPLTMYELNCSFQNNIECFLKGVRLKNDFNSKVKYLSSVLLETKQKELELFLGKSSLSKSLIKSKVSSKPNELLGIDEFKKLQECYNSLQVKYSTDAGEYLVNKIIGIEQYYKHSIARSGKFIEVDSYPVAYKYFSVFLFLSSEEVVKTTNYTASYISLFRAFEVYCEGLLLSQSKAKIDTYIDQYGNSFLNCFQVLKKGNYIKPSGFGPKWGAIREAKLTNTLHIDIIAGLDLHKRLRNINALTHGDLLCTLEVYNEFKNIILQTIEYFENKFCQQTLNWTILKNNMSNQFVYNMLPIVGNMLIDSYCVSRVKLK